MWRFLKKCGEFFLDKFLNVVLTFEFGKRKKRWRDGDLVIIVASIVGSRFSDRAHYNEFVESGAKSWALMRRRLVLRMKGTQNQAAQHPREKGPLARGREYANPSRSCRSLPPVSGPPSLCAVSLVIYSSLPFILLLHLLVIHAYPQVHVPSAILFGALWVTVAPIALSRDHIHIKGG